VVAEWRRLEAQARGIADRLLAPGPTAVNRLGAQMDRYGAIKKSLEGHPYLEDPVSGAGDGTRHWEQAEWRRLTTQLLLQARHVADLLLTQGPAAVDSLGPLMDRYAEVKRSL
jgi:hypothetical protein